MKAKIYLENAKANTVTLVATFSSNQEATQCANFLQSKVMEGTLLEYFVDYRENGVQKRYYACTSQFLSGLWNYSNELTKQENQRYYTIGYR